MPRLPFVLGGAEFIAHVYNEISSLKRKKSSIGGNEYLRTIYIFRTGMSRWPIVRHVNRSLACLTGRCRSRRVDICQRVSGPAVHCTWDRLTSHHGAGRRACVARFWLVLRISKRDKIRNSVQVGRELQERRSGSVLYNGNVVAVVLSTLCLKKVPIFKLSVTLSNRDRFSKFMHCWKASAYKICYKTRMTLPISP